MQRHLGIAGDDHDATIRHLIDAATADLKNTAGLTLTTTTYKLSLDQFPRCGFGILLPYPPFQSLTSVTYYDEDRVQQVLNVADLDDIQIRGGNTTEAMVYPGAANPIWPSTFHGLLSAVEIVYVAGWTDADQVPYLAQAYIKEWCRHHFDNADGYLPQQVERGLNSLANTLWCGHHADPDSFPF